MTDVDAIVLDLDGGPMLRVCLESLLAQTMPPRRIIVFDNGSRTPIMRAALPSSQTIELHRSETNLGFAGGVNAAFAFVTASYVALVNNDLIADRDWLETLVRALDTDPKLAAVQSVIRRDDHTIDGAGIDVSDGTIRQLGHGRPLGTALPEAWGVSATAALYRVEALGGRFLDERFFAYYEDVDLCARLHDAGGHTRVLPVIAATHRGSQSASRLGRRALWLRTRNRYFVARLHPGIGRIAALLWEDARLLLRGRTSFVGVIAGLFTRL